MQFFTLFMAAYKHCTTQLFSIVPPIFVFNERVFIIFAQLESFVQLLVGGPVIVKTLPLASWDYGEVEPAEILGLVFVSSQKIFQQISSSFFDFC